MLARYIAIWKLRGANKLPTKQSTVELASLSEPQITATITADPGPHFFHIDRAGAILALLGRGRDVQSELLLAAEIEEIKARRTDQTKKAKPGVFLVFVGEKDVRCPDFNGRRDAGEFTFCIDDVDKTPIREAFRPFC